MSESPRRWLVAYDVSDDHRRERVARLLSSYGDRVQYSVFVIDARTAKLIRLRTALTVLMKIEHDSILIADLGLVANLDPTRFTYLGCRRMSLATLMGPPDCHDLGTTSVGL